MKESPVVKLWDSERLEHPFSEFNARGGQNRDEYLEHVRFHETDPSKADEAWQKIDEQLPKFEFLTDPKGTNQKIRVQRFNPDANPNNAIIMHRPFGNDLPNRQLQYQSYLIAQEYQNRQIIVFENLGTGKSSYITSKQRERLHKEKTFDALIEPVLRILQTEGIYDLSSIGYSMAVDCASSIAACARDFGISVDRLLVMGGPSVIMRTKRELARDFKIDVYEKYQAHPYRSELVNAAGIRKSMPRKIGALAVILARNIKDPVGMLACAEAMTCGNLQNTLERALDTQQNLRVTLGLATKDTLTPPRAVNEINQELRKLYGAKRIGIATFPGDDHGFSDAPDLFIPLVRTALT